jgi:uncharacterized membrane protein YvlD (DUF360 family)
MTDGEANGRAHGVVRIGLELLRDWRPTMARLRSMLRAGVTSFVVLWITLWSLPGITSTDLPELLRLVVLVAVVGALIRPVLVACAVALGGVGALLLGICVQSLVLWLAFAVDPGINAPSVPAVFVAAWVAAALTALVNWLADAGSDDAFLGQALRQMERGRRRTPGRREPGVLIIQIDGLGAGLLGWAVRAGNLPNLGRWLRGGTHRTVSWHTGLPATTPASQAGILHGNVAEVPAFRWYERDTRRLVVANRPSDAAAVEKRISDGRGLLADGGVSISNIFSGDAAVSLLTVSNAALPGRSARGYAAFMANPYGLARGLILSVGEMLKELHQARRQRRRGISPRVSRLGPFIVLRAVTNVLLRDLNVALIAEQMARGAPVIFCDFVDYDEVAHHAGPARPEALHALEGVDRVLGTLQRLARHAARPYEIVVLSDHGQSQGAPFRQRYGETLEQVIRQLLADGERTGAATGQVEEWGPVNTLLTSVIGQTGRTGAAARAAMRTRTTAGDVVLGPADEEGRAIEGGRPELVVVASGNLAMVYLADHPHRLTVEELATSYPALVPGLAGHPGVGFVVVDSVAVGPVAIGSQGTHALCTGAVEGEDPLEPYGSRAVEDLLAHQGRAHVGDLVVVSRLDPGTDEVAAFEELVGCHGGLGGGQTDAVLVHPAGWTLDERPLVGPDSVYRQLVRWLDELGLRQPPSVVPPPAEPPADERDQEDGGHHGDDPLPGLGEHGPAGEPDRRVRR